MELGTNSQSRVRDFSQRCKKDKALNPDLWEKLINLCEYHQVEIRWLKGHAGDPENERADKLANQAMQQKKLRVDKYYMKNFLKNKSKIK